MVNRRRLLPILLILSILLPIATFTLAQSAWAAGVQYHLEKQWVKIWINKDGTIDLQYTLQLVCEEGSFSYVYIGQPVGDFKIGEAFDTDGHPLTMEDATQGTDYRVKVFLFQPLTAGRSVEFTATTNVGHMIWKDETNPGNVGLQFMPTTWNVEIRDLRVLIVLPAGVSKDQIRVTPDWDNADSDPSEEGRLVVYWERKDVSPNTKFQVGLSFPATVVEHYETRTAGLPSWAPAAIVSFVLIFFLIIVTVIVAAVRAARRNYIDPKMQMETLGIKRGFTAVEASCLLDVSSVKIIVMMLYSLLLKHAVWVASSQPSLKLQVAEEFKDDTAMPSETRLRYYEKDFLHAVKSDGSLDEKTLAETFMHVRSAVENSMKGYCRADTIAFYRKTVQKAWEQVERAGTSDLASKMFDEKLLWLMLDKDFRMRSENTFKEIDFHPMPSWWWYWYGYTQYHPNPTYEPRTSQGQVQVPPTIPGFEFANNIATAIEKSASNIVVSIEKFTNSILPAPPPSQNTSRTPVHRNASCACACVSCACVCACVSCACACASGGVG